MGTRWALMPNPKPRGGVAQGEAAGPAPVIPRDTPPLSMVARLQGAYSDEVAAVIFSTALEDGVALRDIHAAMGEWIQMHDRDVQEVRSDG